MEIKYTPTVLQHAFHQNKEKEFVTTMPRAAGASTALVMDMFMFASENPKATLVLVTHNQKEIYSIFDKMLPKEAFKKHFVEPVIDLQNKSQIYILDPLKNHRYFISTRPEYLGIDRCSFPGEYIKSFIKGRCKDSTKSESKFREIRSNYPHFESEKWKEIEEEFKRFDSYVPDFLHYGDYEKHSSCEKNDQ